MGVGVLDGGGNMSADVSAVADVGRYPLENEFDPTGGGLDGEHLRIQGPQGEGSGREVWLNSGGRSAALSEDGHVGPVGAADEDQLGVGVIQGSDNSCQDGVIGEGVCDRGREFHDKLVVHLGVFRVIMGATFVLADFAEVDVI